MVYPEHVTLLMQTTLQGKPGIKTLEADAKISTFADITQFDLDLTNRDLLHRHFVVDESTLISHENGMYQSNGPALKMGRPHHIVLYTKFLG